MAKEVFDLPLMMRRYVFVLTMVVFHNVYFIYLIYESYMVATKNYSGAAKIVYKT